jgi:hypothetical protein
LREPLGVRVDSESLEQVRRLGAWGGTTYGRHQRLRRARAQAVRSRTALRAETAPKPFTLWTHGFLGWRRGKATVPELNCDRAPTTGLPEEIQAK